MFPTMMVNSSDCFNIFFFINQMEVKQNIHQKNSMTGEYYNTTDHICRTKGRAGNLKPLGDEGIVLPFTGPLSIMIMSKPQWVSDHMAT